MSSRSASHEAPDAASEAVADAGAGDAAAGAPSAALLFTPARQANAFEETVQRLLQSIRRGR